MVIEVLEFIPKLIEVLFIMSLLYVPFWALGMFLDDESSNKFDRYAEQLNKSGKKK